MPHDPSTKELMPAEVLGTLRDITNNWMMFGTYLGIPYHRLQEIDEATKMGVLMLGVLNEWIHLKPEEATIQALIGAVRSPAIINNESLAQRIESDTRIKEMFGL